MPKSKEFISSSDSDSDAEPKPKKKKPEKKEEEKKKPEKKEEEKKKPESSGAKKGNNGEQMFQLSKMRFATVSEFRGKVMVSIREYYDADGELRPGKKGITLTLEQWNSLKDQVEDIDRAVKEF